MRKSRGSKIWAYLMASLVYLALGLVSGGLAVWVSSQWITFAYPKRVGAVVFVITWFIGAVLIDVQIKSEPVKEEGS